MGCKAEPENSPAFMLLTDLLSLFYCKLFCVLDLHVIRAAKTPEVSVSVMMVCFGVGYCFTATDTKAY
jgi:hypothetical protein